MRWVPLLALLAAPAVAGAQGLRGAAVEEEAAEGRRLVVNFQTGQVDSEAPQGATEEQILQGEVHVEGTFSALEGQILTSYLTDMTRTISNLPHVQVSTSYDAPKLVYHFNLLPPPGEENTLVADMRLTWTHSYLFQELNTRKNGEVLLDDATLFDVRLRTIEVVTKQVLTPLPTATSLTTSRTSTSAHTNTLTSSSPHSTTRTETSFTTDTWTSLSVLTSTTTTTRTSITWLVGTTTFATVTSTSATEVTQTFHTETLRSTRTTTEAVWTPSTGTTEEDDNMMMIVMVSACVGSVVILMVGTIWWCLSSDEAAVQKKLSNSMFIGRVIKGPVLHMHRSVTRHAKTQDNLKDGTTPDGTKSEDTVFGDAWVEQNGDPLGPDGAPVRDDSRRPSKISQVSPEARDDQRRLSNVSHLAPGARGDQRLPSTASGVSGRQDQRLPSKISQLSPASGRQDQRLHSKASQALHQPGREDQRRPSKADGSERGSERRFSLASGTRISADNPAAQRADERRPSRFSLASNAAPQDRRDEGRGVMAASRPGMNTLGGDFSPGRNTLGSDLPGHNRSASRSPSRAHSQQPAQEERAMRSSGRSPSRAIAAVAHFDVPGQPETGLPGAVAR